jgi:AraC family transcriptional regulator of adaptative response/methylated-DNA-[protein]-cysteine methyltransferase
VPANETKQKVLRACRYIESLKDRIPTLEELGVHVGLSPTHLQRVFKRALGISPRQYADTLRVERLKRNLREGQSIAGAMYGAGYSSSSRLYESARAKLGMTPKSYQTKATGEEILYLTIKSPLGGHLLVATTEVGICAVRLGNSAKGLVDELKIEFEGASLKRQEDDRIRAWLASIVDYLGGHGDLLKLPFDIQATAFQRQVWDAIRAIPMGSTASYSELALRIGRPTAARSVATACARNPVALVIPCHRVVPKSGGSGEYRWGKERKRQLLENEKQR